jgi:hypothetical protein
MTMLAPLWDIGVHQLADIVQDDGTHIIAAEDFVSLVPEQQVTIDHRRALNQVTLLLCNNKEHYPSTYNRSTTLPLDQRQLPPHLHQQPKPKQTAFNNAPFDPNTAKITSDHVMHIGKKARRKAWVIPPAAMKGCTVSIPRSELEPQPMETDETDHTASGKWDFTHPHFEQVHKNPKRAHRRSWVYHGKRHAVIGKVKSDVTFLVDGIDVHQSWITKIHARRELNPYKPITTITKNLSKKSIQRCIELNQQQILVEYEPSVVHTSVLRKYLELGYTARSITRHKGLLGPVL